MVGLNIVGSAMRGDGDRGVDDQVSRYNDGDMRGPEEQRRRSDFANRNIR